MAPLSPLLIPDAAKVESFTGALLLGLVFAWGLFGLLSCQVYIYSQAFIKDRLTLKILVYAIYAMQLTQVVLFTIQGFQIFVSGFGDFVNLDNVRESWFSACILDGMVACVVQVFYARRVWILSERRLPSIFILLTSLISLVASLTSGVYSKSLDHLSKLFITPEFIVTGVWEASAALCDILIVGFTVYYLKRRSPQGAQFKHTSALISRITRMTVETGSLTASVAIAIIIATYLPGHLGYFVGFVCTLSGLYANSFMAVLNSRINYGMHTCMSTCKDGETEVDRHLPIFRVRSLSTLKRHHTLFGSSGGVLTPIPHDEMARESTLEQSTSTVNPQAGSFRPHEISNEQDMAGPAWSFNRALLVFRQQRLKSVVSRCLTLFDAARKTRAWARHCVRDSTEFSEYLYQLYQLYQNSTTTVQEFPMFPFQSCEIINDRHHRKKCICRWLSANGETVYSEILV